MISTSSCRKTPVLFFKTTGIISIRVSEKTNGLFKKYIGGYLGKAFSRFWSNYTTKKSKEPSFISSIGKVLFADIMISFDNVIGVVGASKGNFEFMIFGLVLSVILTGALATYLANYIQKHLWIAYVGLGFILLVALQLVIGGLVDLDILSINEQFKKYF